MQVYAIINVMRTIVVAQVVTLFFVVLAFIGLLAKAVSMGKKDAEIKTK